MSIVQHQETHIHDQKYLDYKIVDKILGNLDTRQDLTAELPVYPMDDRALVQQVKSQMYELSELAQRHNIRIKVDRPKGANEKCCLWWSGHPNKANHDLHQLGAAIQSNTKNNSSFELTIDLH
ncbi:MAG: hypothetical protein ACXAD7_25555 [Candidatus Kariarchaeaceae archaeon]|jgi:hypothetical protein